ncbi:MAG: 2-dehydropantoate 2-reductase [Verrucomicrobia bacterium]|nr:2-dehydropantoate 2-reductase [Verrucomicrobiota bacterium]
MRILIVGLGALGGTIAARAISAGIQVSLAARTLESAVALRGTGLQVTGVGGSATAKSITVATVDDYGNGEKFDLIIIATKAHAALELGPALQMLLAAGGALLPIQNGGVSRMLADRLKGSTVVGGLSNLGATMVSPGIYEQRNAGHLLIGELAGGHSRRVDQIAHALQGAVAVQTTANLSGAIWSKLLLNCSVTTLGAVAGCTMRRYLDWPFGRELFRRMYDEALTVALACGIEPARMIVEPIPPDWNGESVEGPAYAGWIDAVMAAYGDLKPSMLQDFERGRQTEIDFINGYVASLGQQHGIDARLNQATTQIVHEIESGRLRPHPDLLKTILGQA